MLFDIISIIFIVGNQTILLYTYLFYSNYMQYLIYVGRTYIIGSMFRMRKLCLELVGEFREMIQSLREESLYRD